MVFTSQETKNSFIKDHASKQYTTKQLVKNYKFASTQDLYQTVSTLRKEGLIPKTAFSDAISRYWKEKKKKQQSNEKVSDSSVKEYRTVYFKDFTVQIHKKSMARLVVDGNSDIHILNA